jgi:hypothetical protein
MLVSPDLKSSHNSKPERHVRFISTQGRISALNPFIRVSSVFDPRLFLQAMNRRGLGAAFGRNQIDPTDF